MKTYSRDENMAGPAPDESDSDPDSPVVAAKEADPAMAEDCVPVDALAMPNESEQMEPPAVGDKVQYSVEGTVSRIEGASAYVKKEAINGQKLPEDKGEAEQPQPDEMATLENDAKSMSGPSY